MIAGKFHGQLSVDSGASPQNGVNGAAEIIQFTTIYPTKQARQVRGTISGTTNRLTVESPGLYDIWFSLSMTLSVSTSFVVQVYKNGVAVPGSSCRPSGTTARTLFHRILVELQAGDYLTLVMTTGGATNVTLVDGVFGCVLTSVNENF